MKLKDFLSVLLKGLGQIMLQESEVTGLLILTGLAAGGWEVALAGLLGSSVGTITAIGFKFDPEKTQSGFFGFSPALVAVAFIVIFGSKSEIWFWIIPAGSLAAFLQFYFLKKKIPAYTFPFILVTWVFYYLYPYAISTSNVIKSNPVFWMQIPETLIRSFGQVIFQSGLISGFLVFIGILINSRRAALYGLLGSVVALWMGLTGDSDSLHAGLYGFNAVLTAIALSSLKKSPLLWTVVGVIFTLTIHYFFLKTNLLHPVGGVLTFPFVAGTWLSLGISNLFNRQTAT